MNSDRFSSTACQKSSRPYLVPVSSQMEMGIPHSVNSTILQLNHLYVIRLSDGEAIWRHAGKKIFLRPRGMVASSFCSLTQRFKEGDNGDRSCQAIRTCQDHLLPCYSLTAPGWNKELQLRCWVHPNPVSRGRALALESPPPLTYDPRPSPPINLTQERVCVELWERREGWSQTVGVPHLTPTFISHVPLPKWMNLSVPQFLLLSNKNNNMHSSHSIGFLWGLNVYFKCLEHVSSNLWFGLRKRQLVGTVPGSGEGGSQTPAD